MNTKTFFTLQIHVVLLLCLAGTIASAAPPRVIEAIPDNGEQGADPTLRSIRIVFDQDMSRSGYSLCGGGDRFPKMRGKPRWLNKRTLEMRVRLVPNHEYSLSINCPSAKNFRSAQGEPALRYPIKFTTGSASPETNTPSRGNTDNAEAIIELRRAIDENYSYYKLHGLDWDSLFAKYAPRLTRAKTPTAFAREAGKLLAHAKDMHISLTANGKTVRLFRRSITRNYNRSLLPKLVPEWQKCSAAVYTGRFPDGIGYILIDSWSRDRAEALQQAYVALWELADAPGLIIDVRPNAGGAEPLAQEFAGCFVDEPVVYAKHVYRVLDQPSGFGKPRQRRLLPNKKRPK